MKKFFQIVTVIASLAVISCQKLGVEEPENSNVEEVTFTVQLPETMTKVIANAEYADALYYMPFVVTQENGVDVSKPLYAMYKTTTVDVQTRTAEVKIRLVKNINYKIVFWAQDADCQAYALSDDLSTVTVDYAGASANDDKRDAFYVCEPFAADGNLNRTVDLRRPFAQINFASIEEDWEAAQYFLTGGLTSEFTATVPNVLNTLTGVAEGAVPVSFVASTAPARTPLNQNGESLLNVGGVDYEGWLAMNYVLANDNQPVISVTAKFTYDGASADVQLTDVPFARNYRTNIIGSFLSDEYDVKVIIVKDFFGDLIY